MNKTKNIKIILGISYILLISIFLWFFFHNFSIQDFTSYELIKANRDTLEAIKNNNIILTSFYFYRNNNLGPSIRVWLSDIFSWRLYLW